MKAREIKFRVWNGAEMVYDVTIGRFGVFYVNPTNNGLDPNDSASLTPFNTKYHEDTPVMQYTGLKDKNGKEIYEGDILMGAYKKLPKIVEYIGACFHLVNIKNVGLRHFSLSRSSAKSMQKIGNIYQNPELI
jgi:uncharacterized phage protein (TIGR01671 family)